MPLVIPRVTEPRSLSALDAVLRPTAAPGVYARTPLFETAMDGLGALITRAREPGTDVIRFPPVMSRAQLETSGYLKSFPHLLGCVSCLHGDESKVRSLGEGTKGRHWTSALEPADLVLTPAACYPLYPLVAARGDALPSSGALFDVASYCFRREATAEPDRLHAFQMRELVCIGSPRAALAFRDRWMERVVDVMHALELRHQLAPASDPFFGRIGRIMALDQIERALKFELLIGIRDDDAPTACMSFNYHQDHFGQVWELRTQDGDVAHTACVAFGMERLCLALFATHGLDVSAWPGGVRAALAM